jgi:hypothetical protein
VLEGKRILRQAFKDLERELPQRVARGVRGLRHPKARYIRIPVAVLSIVGGVFSFLPVLGLWMLPLGLLLLAHDVPFLRKPVGRFTSWGAQRWAKFRRPSLSDEAGRELDRPNLPTPSVAVMSAPDLKPNPADPLSNPTPTPDIVPPKEPPQQLPNEPPTPNIPGAPTPVRPPAGPNHPLGPPEPIERDARTMVRRAS